MVELYCCFGLLTELSGLVRDWPIGEVLELDWFLSIIAFKRGCSLDGFVDEVKPWPSACSGN